ncbi:NAD(P)-dependent oxidoreductase [Helicobacter cholecystus]|uniref:NAD(P)-dependent oxidoreductase n=1 Tax=Helicobacter cholecystus TaxID=45498 RepID=A0A3D8ITM9_9HELI|nr:NAD(P)-dependent oxidoreductase [Helicobacter cholecystus]RDU68649.1 NAD(P)-dependent oxidoreductase [Helicobacter cholecystus]VEJ24442.1 dTDP-glucose 4,6-dehydratase [Helicobacter cholecystus]
MKILVTGATGFIGKNLIKYLSSTYQIIALVQDSSDISMIRQYCTPYRYSKKLEDLIDFIKNERFDGVVHLATYYQPSHSIEDLDKMLHANILFGTYLLEALNHCPPKFFINTMTFSQFANSSSYSPAGLYDATKQAFCDIIRFYSTKLSTIFCNLLLYNTYGSNDTRPKIFNLWSKIAKTQESFEMSLGEQKIDISHIDDVIEGFSTLINLCSQNKINNLSTFTLENKRYSLRELAEIFAQITKSTLPIIWGAKPYRDNEIMNPISSKNSGLQKLPNWKPKVSLHKGIKDVFAK